MSDSTNDRPALHFGPFRLDPSNALLMLGERTLKLWPKDMDVLCYLAQHQGKLVTKDELLDEVWKQRFISESVLKNVVSRLRNILGDDPRQPRYIETSQRRGYRFIADVVTVPNGPTALAPLYISSPTPNTLVGRDSAQQWLNRQLTVATAGRTQLVWLTGEAGIGKSSLINSFTLEAAESSVAWIALGQCVEHSAAVEPYLPMLEALSGLCKAHLESGVVALMRQVAPTWLVQLPWFVTDDDRQQLLAEVTGATRERMLREFSELLDRITAIQPLILVIEDLHWSDAATLQLLGYLARRKGTARVLLLASLRPAELLAAAHPLKAAHQALRQQRLGDELELTLFSAQDTAAYLDRHAPGVAWPQPLINALHEHAGGLPLFTAAILQELGRHTVGSDGIPTLQQLREVPKSIFGLIEQQHAQLPASTQLWLEAASVAGIEFAHTPLADALELAPDTLQQTLDSLARAGTWLRESGVTQLPDGRLAGRYAFRHAIYRNVLYELAGATKRVQLHRRLAAALQRTYASDSEAIAAELAVHFEMGQDFEQAVPQLAIAAHRALRRLAAAEAASIARNGLNLLKHVGQRDSLRNIEIELNVELGVAMNALTGVTSTESNRAFAAAADLMNELPPGPARVAALHGIWWAALTRGKFARAQSMAAQVISQGEQRHDPQLSFAGHSAAGITLVHVGHMAEARKHLSLALQLLDRATLPEAMFTFEPGVQLMSYLSLALQYLGKPKEAAEQVRQAVERAEGLKHPLSLLMAHQFSALNHCMAEDFEALRTLTELALHAATDQGLERGTGTLTWLKGRAQVALGNVDEGLAIMRHGRELQMQHGQLQGMTWWHEHYARACLQAGRIVEALDTLDQGQKIAEQTGEHASSAAMRQLRARTLPR